MKHIVLYKKIKNSKVLAITEVIKLFESINSKDFYLLTNALYINLKKAMENRIELNAM